MLGVDIYYKRQFITSAVCTETIDAFSQQFSSGFQLVTATLCVYLDQFRFWENILTDCEITDGICRTSQDGALIMRRKSSAFAWSHPRLIKHLHSRTY